MAAVGEIHFRVTYLIAAAGVLLLLRQPLRYPDSPGSRWFALTIASVSAWLCGVGLYYFVHSRAGSFALYCLVLFSITLCFVGWILIAVEFSTGRSPPRPVLVALAAIAAVHLLLLVTNYVELHELVYRSSSFVDDGGGLNVRRGPAFWVHVVLIYVLVFLSTVLFAAEWANSSGLRRRQAGILAVTPVFGIGASLLWFAEVLPFPHDPTPVGVTVGVVLLSWALYREKFVEIVPVASHAVVERMTDAVVILDDRNRVVDWNSAAADLFDAAGESAGIAAEAFFDSVPSETFASFAGSRRTETRVSLELDGRDRHFSVSISPIETDAGTHGRVVVVRDVTDSKRREEQLLKQNEYLDEFAGIVSHDLRGPLMEIRGSADAAARTGDLSHVEHVLDATERLDNLVDDLLRLARTGRRVDDVEPVDLADAAETAWRRVWSRDAELSVETDHVVVADPDRLLQLLENVFRNAIEHGSRDREGDDAPGRDREGDGVLNRDREDDEAPGREPPSPTTVGSPVAVAVDDPGGTAAPSTGGRSSGAVSVTVGSLPDGFYVEDDGPGIPDADLDRVFERGYTTAEGGTGLGLSIVRQIAGAHGWSVRAGQGADGGARFEVAGVVLEAAED